MGFGGFVVISAMILWFTFDMIKNGALHSIAFVLDATWNSSSIEPSEKCITQNEYVTNTYYAHTFIQ